MGEHTDWKGPFENQTLWYRRTIGELWVVIEMGNSEMSEGVIYHDCPECGGGLSEIGCWWMLQCVDCKSKFRQMERPLGDIVNIHQGGHYE